ncbi:immunoglobulin-like domain-containing protein [Pseudomonas sp. BIC9C]|uniref:immunoglobulin-like domain-containing protein n=1 Tax=Pseudomonas sp. BIC9C TaxID=3078458 RepID=UPI002AD23D0C|nr:immunoglobulin-like domain-containing protein [Pseudomonas sp. BIC9C]
MARSSPSKRARPAAASWSRPPANDVCERQHRQSTTITGTTGGNFENLVPNTTPAVTTITDSVDTTA